MKTLDEVIKALEFCQQMTAGEDHCHECPYAKKDRYNDWSFDCNDSEVDALHYLKELLELRKTSQELRSDCEALKNFWAEQQANPPLTFEELKSMQGKPVWVEYDPKRFPALDSCWGIATTSFTSWEGSECWTLVRPGAEYVTPVAEYGKTWQAYRKER